MIMAKGDNLLHVWKSDQVLMTAINTYITEKQNFPFMLSAETKIRVPMVHKIAFDFGFNQGDFPAAAGAFTEYFCQLTTTQKAAIVRNDDENLIAGHAVLLLDVGVTTYEGHHGERVHTFDPPLPLPFDDLWLCCFSVNAAAVIWSGCEIYFTFQDMTAEEVMLMQANYK